jgi:hypothetical protein
LFASAALLFLVEPMFAKMVLPYLGGSPAVWNTCVVFFQATMLAGYVYAHVLTRTLPIRTQVLVHAALMLVVTLTLPIAIPSGWTPPVDRTPAPALLLLMAATVGLPFFVVSATAPLVQRWFSQTTHPSARDPYFLYSASNLGSVVALVAYPALIEPAWSLSHQGVIWAGAYGVFASAMTVCAIAAVRLRDHSPRVWDEPQPIVAAVTWDRKLRWLVLSFVPSSLMLGVTTFLSTDVAAIPLLWAIPLTLYLLSFVAAFSTRPMIPQRVAGKMAAVTMLPLTLTLATGMVAPASVLMPLHVVAFFGFALLLHGQLARERPDARNLTPFYLWISLGGVLGGAFNTFAAPYMFTGVVEYPLMLVAACALVPAGDSTATRWDVRDALIPLAVGVLLALLLVGVKASLVGTVGVSIGIGLVTALYVACVKRPRRLAGGIAFILVAGVVFGPSHGDQLFAQRTFFGVLRVRGDAAGHYHTLYHGSTLHGEEALDPLRRREPRIYYHRLGPIGQVMEALSGRLAQGSVGVFGLGAGSLAAYATPGQTWTFFEIDPAVVRIARAPQFFRYLADCGSRCHVVLGDARLSLARSPAKYDLLILDAFSSDAIPVHLMTREALQLYVRSLNADGVIAFHISNRHLNLRPVLGALATDLRLVALVQLDEVTDSESGHQPSEWVVMTRAPQPLEPLLADRRWQRLRSDGTRVWTDEFSNIFNVLTFIQR